MGKNKEENEEAIDETIDETEATSLDALEPEEAAEETTESQELEDESPIEEKPSQPVKKANGFKRFISTKKGKVIFILGIIVLILAIIGTLLAIPTTRYGILGNFVKKNVHVVVMDSSTMKPISQATITLGNATVKTDKKGEATLSNVAVGEYTLQIAKGYYKSSEAAYVVPVLGDATQPHVMLVATGRQVTLNVKNKISGVVLAGASVKISDTSAITDDKGTATIVLPADKQTLKGTVSLDGYNQSAVEVKVTEQADANNVALTPAGEVYYLSKQTGKINVMKSQLDGTNASVIVEGTGNESDSSTVLLAARDWNYMALSATRSDDTKKSGQLYLVDAKNGGLKTIDEGDASFQLVGWSNHKFVYIVTRNNGNPWDSQTQRLKSYDAETGKLTILDENTATGDAYNDFQAETIGYPYILENKVVYTKVWNQGIFAAAPEDKKSAIMSVNPDGSQKQRVKEFSVKHDISISASLYAPQEIYFRVVTDNVTPAAFYEYEDGAVKGASSNDDKFFNTAYPTYLLSPSSQKTFWSESRDGKNTLFVGDKDGKDTTTLASQSDYTAYGWYGDKYVLLSKNDSELYIASVDKPFDQPLKVTNFHKPSVRFPGYGYGYGGQ